MISSSVVISCVLRLSVARLFKSGRTLSEVRIIIVCTFASVLNGLETVNSVLLMILFTVLITPFTATLDPIDRYPNELAVLNLVPVPITKIVLLTLTVPAIV